MPPPPLVIPEAASRHAGIGEPRDPPWLSDPGSQLRSGRDDDGEAVGKPDHSGPARPRVPDLIRDPAGGASRSGREEETAPSAGCHAGFRLTVRWRSRRPENADSHVARDPRIKAGG
jgi:hypothetical protein